MLKNIIKNKFGLILTETLMAVAVIAMGSVIVGTIIRDTVSMITVSKDYTLAQNLITEAMESVKNVRDTNWLRQPANQRTCWLRMEPIRDAASSGSDCLTGTVQEDTNYVIRLDPDSNNWFLESPSASSNQGLDLSLGGSAAEPYRLHIDRSSGVDRYVSSDESNLEDSKYYRSVKFLNDSDTDDRTILTEIKIEWMDGAKVRSISWQGPLYNYSQ